MKVQAFVKVRLRAVKKIYEFKTAVRCVLLVNRHPQLLNVKNTLKKFLAITLLSALAVASLPAQTNFPGFGGMSGKDKVEIEKAKIEAKTDIAQRKLDDEKSIRENRKSARKMMVHDLA